MSFSELFIRRPVMTMVLTVSVVLFGILSYLRLPVNDLPAVDYPVIQVQANYPGASPDTVANSIATPLERQFMQINGLGAGDLEEHPGTYQLDFAICVGQKRRCSGHRRPNGNFTGYGQFAGGSTFAADILQDQS